jgi:hypothetical protein
MAIWRLAGHREFFGRRREAAEPETIRHKTPNTLGAAELLPVAIAAEPVPASAGA